MKKNIQIAHHQVGASAERVFIAADIGSNHRQDKTLAYETIDAAAEAGAQAVKFQSLDVGELYYAPSSSVQELYAQIKFEEQWHYDLKEHCDKRGILFFSSPTYFKAIEILEKAGVSLFKLASAQVGTFPQLMEKVVALQKPTFLSTGIVTYGELEKAVHLFKKANNPNFIILHCNSLYPTPYEKVHLNLIKVYEAMFGNPVGWSDHTLGIHVSLASVACGAVAIEKHFTLDRKIKTPDSEVSLEPHELRQLVKESTEVKLALREGVRLELEPFEREFKQSLLYRPVLKVNKRKGEKFKSDDFDFKRHPEGVDCRDLNFVLQHMAASVDLKSGTLLEWKHLEGH